jgi:hypothetical protein
MLIFGISLKTYGIAFCAFGCVHGLFLFLSHSERNAAMVVDFLLLALGAYVFTNPIAAENLLRRLLG